MHGQIVKMQMMPCATTIYFIFQVYTFKWWFKIWNKYVFVEGIFVFKTEENINAATTLELCHKLNERAFGISFMLLLDLWLN